jgi:hypothetical protein
MNDRTVNYAMPISFCIPLTLLVHSYITMVVDMEILINQRIMSFEAHFLATLTRQVLCSFSSNFNYM